MVKQNGRMILLLSTVVLAALAAGFVLRGMVIKDLRDYLESIRTDLVRVVAADMERAYQENNTWNRKEAAAAAVRARMLGLEIRVMDAGGELVMNTEQAFATLPPAAKEGIPAGGEALDAAFHPYPLTLGGKRVGLLDMRFLSTGKEDLFIKRAGNAVLAGSLLLAGLAAALVFIFTAKSSEETRTPVPVPSPGKGRAARKAAHGDKAPLFPSPAGPSQSTGGAGVAGAAEKGGEPKVVAEESAEDDDEDDEDRQAMAEDMDRIRLIVAGLDRLSKAQALGRSLRKQSLDLTGYLQDLVEQIRDSSNDERITFTVECEGGLLLSADRDCLSGIMTNLLENAAKSMNDGGVVTLSAARDGGAVALSVKDTGRGIRRKDLPHIFERFYRASGSGIGLGLAIVKELADACGATIDVRTERGRGSTFTVRFPAAV